jgi:hypothetical protein
MLDPLLSKKICLTYYYLNTLDLYRCSYDPISKHLSVAPTLKAVVNLILATFTISSSI